jgi:hypothetical protein
MSYPRVGAEGWAARGQAGVRSSQAGVRSSRAQGEP